MVTISELGTFFNELSWNYHDIRKTCFGCYLYRKSRIDSQVERFDWTAFQLWLYVAIHERLHNCIPDPSHCVGAFRDLSADVFRKLCNVIWLVIRDVTIVSFKRLADKYRLNSYRIKQYINENGGQNGGDDDILLFRLLFLQPNLMQKLSES